MVSRNPGNSRSVAALDRIKWFRRGSGNNLWSIIHQPITNLSNNCNDNLNDVNSICAHFVFMLANPMAAHFTVVTACLPRAWLIDWLVDVGSPFKRDSFPLQPSCVTHISRASHTFYTLSSFLLWLRATRRADTHAELHTARSGSGSSSSMKQSEIATVTSAMYSKNWRCHSHLRQPDRQTHKHTCTSP